MHEVIRTSVSPNTALAVGLKVDAGALPAAVKAGILDGPIKLDNPTTTVVLLGLGAVVGVVGQVEGGTLTRVGITCALCHSTVDNSFAAGIGSRLDGWPKPKPGRGPHRSLVAGAHARAESRLQLVGSWAIRPPIQHRRRRRRVVWNAYVAITQMHGHGRFVDPRIGVSVNNPPDPVSAKLEPLSAYQFSLEIPNARPGTFDAAAAQRGKQIFHGVAECTSCHPGGALTDVNANRLPAAEEVGVYYREPGFATGSRRRIGVRSPVRWSIAT